MLGFQLIGSGALLGGAFLRAVMLRQGGKRLVPLSSLGQPAQGFIHALDMRGGARARFGGQQHAAAGARHAPGV
ncbi:hypothetical protein D3C72_2262410 [compost metagenome]